MAFNNNEETNEENNKNNNEIKDVTDVTNEEQKDLETDEAIKEEEESFSWKKEIFGWVQTIIFAMFLAFIVNSFLVVNAKVPTGSMENTVMTGDRILAWRGSYWFNDPEAGDIIVFKYPDDPTGETLYLKRIIGVGGDTVLIKEGNVYVNDEIVDEPFIKETTFGNFGPFEVPEGHSFVMGDNRNSSEDSRYWKNTYVEDEDILGKVIFRYFKEFAWLW